MITELEQASAILKEVDAITKEIDTLENLKLFAIKANDNVLVATYSKPIRELKAKRHLLSESIRYVELKTFAAVIKTLLTKQQYNDAWRSVDKLIENPRLMQDWRDGFKQRDYADNSLGI